MKDKKVFVLLNGEQPNNLPDLSKYDIVCATDGAYQYLKNNIVKIDFISGDFDSIVEIPKEVETIHTPNQDFTDFDKILQILIEKGFAKADIYGASGGEQDHFLGNLHTAISFKNKINLTFFDDYQTYFLADKNNKIQTQKNSIISLIPLLEAKNITTKGLQYPLKNEDLVFGKRIGTRNKVIANKIEISFTEGELFIFIENKENGQKN